jgi:UDP:flavonoid glycosyltransferase YjiC (YdhE family)
VAQLAGVPFVTLCAALHFRRDPYGRLPPPITSWPPGVSAIARLRNGVAIAAFDAATAPFLFLLNRRRRSHALPPHRRIDDTLSDRACLAQLPPALDPMADPDRPFHLLGPLVNVADREANEATSADRVAIDRFERQPMLYISFGLDARVPVELYGAVLDGSMGLGFFRVVSAGRRRVVEQLKRFEDAHTIVVSVAPHLMLLRRASLVVTHAGLNTVLESLLYGLPMLMMPIYADQPAVAARVAWAGAGLVIPAKAASPARVRSALIHLRDERAYREKAQALASSIRIAGGLRRAADLVEAALPPNS